ncbi:uncharacterized protein M421DRAFT_44060 [Didymella exigua CBS 183.55]
MPQRNNVKKPSNETHIQLALQAIQQDATLSVRRAAAIYQVSQSTLGTRLTGTSSRRDCKPNMIRMTSTEEEVIIRHILDLDTRGFAPTYDAVRDMADKLLAARGAGQVGVHWPRNFVKRTDSLTTRFN